MTSTSFLGPLLDHRQAMEKACSRLSGAQPWKTTGASSRGAESRQRITPSPMLRGSGHAAARQMQPGPGEEERWLLELIVLEQLSM